VVAADGVMSADLGIRGTASRWGSLCACRPARLMKNISASWVFRRPGFLSGSFFAADSGAVMRRLCETTMQALKSPAPVGS